MPGLLPTLGPVGMRSRALMTVALRVMGNLVTPEDTDTVARLWRTAGRASSASTIARPSPRPRALRPRLAHRRHRGVELGQPVALVLRDQAHAPGEGIGPRTGDAGLDEGVEHPALGLVQPGHDGHGQPGEDLGGGTAGDAPGDLAACAPRLAGDLDPGAPGVLAEPGDPAGLGLRVSVPSGAGMVPWMRISSRSTVTSTAVNQSAGSRPVSQSLTLNVPWSVVM